MVAAGAGSAIGEEDGVAEFAGVAVLAGVEFAVNENSHADAFVDVQEDHIFKVRRADFLIGNMKKKIV